MHCLHCLEEPASWPKSSTMFICWCTTRVRSLRQGVNGLCGARASCSRDAQPNTRPCRDKDKASQFAGRAVVGAEHVADSGLTIRETSGPSSAQQAFPHPRLLPDEAAAIKGFTTFFCTTSMNSRSSAWHHEIHVRTGRRMEEARCKPREVDRTKSLWNGFCILVLVSIPGAMPCLSPSPG